MQKTKIFTPILAVLLVLVVGYLTLQSEGISKGFLFDFGGVPSINIAQRYPWELQLAILLVAFMAVMVYRRVANDRATKILASAALVATAVLSLVFYEAIHITRTNLFAMAFVNGGTSPLTLGLMAATLADVMSSRAGGVNVRRRPAAYQRGWIASRK
ncbi:hypothetical protein ACIPWF_11005 [Paenarthrobacter sp. NPDC089989]|uniref:hypothetical protein n=1 Tax=unclassified Paenarthrobacter TaxID=2634190 RepID=UPI0037FBAFA1